MDWQTMLVYITGSVDQELLSRNEYLVAEAVTSIVRPETILGWHRKLVARKLTS